MDAITAIERDNWDDIKDEDVIKQLAPEQSDDPVEVARRDHGLSDPDHLQPGHLQPFVHGDAVLAEQTTERRPPAERVLLALQDVAPPAARQFH